MPMEKAELAQTTTCKKCGIATWQGAHMCSRCKNKKPMAECHFPTCTTLFVHTGKAKYCPEHKSMSPSQRVRAIKVLEL